MPLESINLAALNQRCRRGDATTLTNTKEDQQRQSNGDNSANRLSNSNKDDDFQATPEELENIKSKMNDPMFVKLMHEYMYSLTDPETLKEEEEYLKQVEREAKEGGNYSFEFIFPKPAFVVELCNPNSTQPRKEDIAKLTGNLSSHKLATTEMKSYINFCVSEKVDEFKEELTEHRRASNWHVPVSVSEKRLEYYIPTLQEQSSTTSKHKDKCSPETEQEQNVTSNKTNNSISTEDSSSSASASNMNPKAVAVATADFTKKDKDQTGATKANYVDSPLCYVYDAVFHPKTLNLANMSNKFLCFMVEIAIEHINNGYNERNGYKFTRLPSKIVAIGKPRNQTVRIKNGKSPFQADTTQPVLTRPQSFKHIDTTTTTTTTNNNNNSNNTAWKDKETNDNKMESKTTHNNSKADNNTVKLQSESESTTTSHLPLFTITHRGYISISDAWNEKVSDKRIGVPAELIVKMHFAPMTTAAALDVQITDDGTAILIQRTEQQTKYDGLIVLPFTVEQEPMSAKLVKRDGVLTLTLKVIPPLRAQEHLESKCKITTASTDNNDNSTNKDDKQGNVANSLESEEENVKSKSRDSEHLYAERATETIYANTYNEELGANEKVNKEENVDNDSVTVEAKEEEHATKLEQELETTTTSSQSQLLLLPQVVPTTEVLESLSSDLTRTQTMLNKVYEARRARLAAINEMNTNKTNKSDALVTNTAVDYIKNTNNVINDDKVESRNNYAKQDHNGNENETMHHAEQHNSKEPEILSDSTSEENAVKHSVLVQERQQEITQVLPQTVRNSHEDEVKQKELKSLQARQDAWQAAIQQATLEQRHYQEGQEEQKEENVSEEHEMKECLLEENDDDAKEEVQLALERERTHQIAQQQEMIMKQQEERAAAMRNKIRDLPLSNALIFSID